MTGIHVNITDLGAAAELGAVRYNLNGRSFIALQAGLPVDEQAALVADLCREGEMPVFVTVPSQRQSEEGGRTLDRRSAVAARLRVAVAAASVAASAACASPLAGG